MGTERNWTLRVPREKIIFRTVPENVETFREATMKANSFSETARTGDSSLEQGPSNEETPNNVWKINKRSILQIYKYDRQKIETFTPLLLLQQQNGNYTVRTANVLNCHSNKTRISFSSPLKTLSKYA